MAELNCKCRAVFSGAHILPEASVSSHFNWGNKFTCFCYLVFILEFSFSLSLVLLYPLLNTHKGSPLTAAFKQPLWGDHCTNCCRRAQEWIGKCSLFRDLHFSVKVQKLSFMTWFLGGPSNPINHLQSMHNFHQISTEGLEQKHLRAVVIFNVQGVWFQKDWTFLELSSRRQNNTLRFWVWSVREHWQLSLGKAVVFVCGHVCVYVCAELIKCRTWI